MGWVRKVLGISPKGKPPLPNTRKQLMYAGLLCLALHPGVILAALYWPWGGINIDREIFIIVNPWLVVTVLGLWLLLLAAFSGTDGVKYKRTATRNTQKERR